MPTDAPGEHTAAPAGINSPIISACRDQVLITGAGFLPNCPVTIRIAYAGEDIVDYLTYISDAEGFLNAALPAAAITAETGHTVTVTDHRRDVAGDSGLLWSNTVTVTPTGG